MPTMRADLPIISVLTCDRPGAFYLPDTLRQIDAEGGADCERRVYVDGLASGVSARLARAGALRDWRVTSLGPGGLGNTEATRRTLAALARDGREVLYFEDDVLLCRNAVARALEMRVPAGAALLSFFDMKEFAPGYAAGVHIAHPLPGPGGGEFWGNQFFRMTAEVLSWLAAQDWGSTSHGAFRSGGDVVMGELLTRHRTAGTVAYHLPCLVEHIGEVSAAFPGTGTARRRATNFIGASADALGLVPHSVG